jgi:hypothetical protein
MLEDVSLHFNRRWMPDRVVTNATKRSDSTGFPTAATAGSGLRGAATVWYGNAPGGGVAQLVRAAES